MNLHATQIIEALGGTAAVARMFDIRMPSVSEWRKSGIPAARLMYLVAVHEKQLNGIDLSAAARCRHLARKPRHPGELGNVTGSVPDIETAAAGQGV